MGSVSLTGADTIVVNGRNIVDLADGNVGEIEFPEGIADAKTGKNGNTIYAMKESGKNATFKVRLLRGSADDKFLNNLLSQQQANFAGFVLMSGEIVKRVGDGQGNILNDTYVMGGGIFTKIPGAKSNADGETDQSVVEYELKFSNAPRALT